MLLLRPRRLDHTITSQHHSRQRYSAHSTFQDSTNPVLPRDGNTEPKTSCFEPRNPPR